MGSRIHTKLKGKKELGFEDDMEEEEEEEEEEVAALYGEEERKRRGVSRKSVSGTAAGAGGGGVVPCCQAEKCSTDLTDAKKYYRRHKVCEQHSKAPVVLVGGLRQRFCQQCSRFHELLEFDEAKRSCRRRLAGHNERRRKNSSEFQGEGSGGKGVVDPLKENHCRQTNQSGRIPITLSGNSKHFQIR